MQPIQLMLIFRIITLQLTTALSRTSTSAAIKQCCAAGHDNSSDGYGGAIRTLLTAISLRVSRPLMLALLTLRTYSTTNVLTYARTHAHRLAALKRCSPGYRTSRYQSR